MEKISPNSEALSTDTCTLSSGQKRRERSDLGINNKEIQEKLKAGEG